MPATKGDAKLQSSTGNNLLWPSRALVQDPYTQLHKLKQGTAFAMVLWGPYAGPPYGFLSSGLRPPPHALTSLAGPKPSSQAVPPPAGLPHARGRFLSSGLRPPLTHSRPDSCKVSSCWPPPEPCLLLLGSDLPM